LPPAPAGATDRYVDVAASVALAALAVQREEELRRAMREIESLSEVYRGTDTDRHQRRGRRSPWRPGVGQRFAQLQMSAREEVLASSKSDIAVVPAEENTEEARRQPGRAVPGDDRAQFLRRAPASRRRLRLTGRPARRSGVPELPLRMLIVDRRMALVPCCPPGSQHRRVDRAPQRHAGR